MSSIRRNLLMLLFGFFAIGTTAAITVIFMSGKTEAQEIYDGNIKGIAYVLLDHFEKDKRDFRLDKDITNENDFLVQIWDDKGNQVYSSYPNIKIPFHAAHGHGDETYNGEKWRYFNTKGSDYYVQVSQPVWMVNLVMTELIASFFIPIVLFFPIAMSYIWFAIAKSTEPLNKLSEDIKKRQVNSLDKIVYKKMPYEVAVITDELNRLFDKLNNAMALQKNFTADAAHQLKTPLTAINLYGEMLKREEDKEKQKEIITDITSAIERATHLINQMLILAKSDTDAKFLNVKGWAVLSELIKRSCVERKIIAAERKIEIVVRNFNDGLSVVGNPELLQILIDNIIDNAIKYNIVGGKVLIETKIEHNKTVLAISDNGIGISESEYDNVFKRFYRILGTKTTGSGLGLSIVDNIAKQHNATIELGRGIDGKGICMKVVFNS